MLLGSAVPCNADDDHWCVLLLQFQLTVNFVALVIAFVSALTKGETPLTVIQLLWVNLIMDALGALGRPQLMPVYCQHMFGSILRASHTFKMHVMIHTLAYLTLSVSD